MLLTIIGLIIVLVLVIWDREYLKRKNDELVELCELCFDNEQDMMNKLEALHKALNDTNYTMYQFNNESTEIQKRLRKNHEILKENTINYEN